MNSLLTPETDNQAPTAADTETVKPLIVHVPVDARGLALGILASIATVFALDWMQKFFVPLLLGIFIAYTLNPLVAWLERIRFPRLLATSVVMLAVVCA